MPRAQNPRRTVPYRVPRANSANHPPYTTGRVAGCHPIDSLTPRERDCIGLHSLGIKTKEIGYLFGISHETVRSLLRAAYVALRLTNGANSPTIAAALLYYDWAMRNPGYDEGIADEPDHQSINLRRR